jgi:hypothetical protein
MSPLHLKSSPISEGVITTSHGTLHGSREFTESLVCSLTWGCVHRAVNFAVSAILEKSKGCEKSIFSLVNNLLVDDLAWRV